MRGKKTSKRQKGGGWVISWVSWASNLQIKVKNEGRVKLEEKNNLLVMGNQTPVCEGHGLAPHERLGQRHEGRRGKAIGGEALSDKG